MCFSLTTCGSPAVYIHPGLQVMISGYWLYLQPLSRYHFLELVIPYRIQKQPDTPHPFCQFFLSISVVRVVRCLPSDSALKSQTMFTAQSGRIKNQLKKQSEKEPWNNNNKKSKIPFAHHVHATKCKHMSIRLRMKILFALYMWHMTTFVGVRAIILCTLFTCFVKTISVTGF